MIDLRHGDYREVLADVTCDLMLVDAPYSARTHGGHDGATRVERFMRHGGDECERRAIDYAGWTPDDVRECIEFFAPRTRGWMVSITDHVLAPAWAEAMAVSGRYVFAPLPWYAPGSRVRLAGDGPSSWTCWIVVGRPRSGSHRDGTPWTKWGTLPGGYYHTQESSFIVGNKPLGLMTDLVSDYSRVGDVVCDPCAGSATTLIAARNAGRIAVGAEVDPGTHALALDRIAGRTPSKPVPHKGLKGLPMFDTGDAA